MKLKFALLGAGRIGKVHADAIAGDPRAELAAVADPIEEAAQSLGQEHGCPVLSIDRIAGSSDIDAVAICTPTDSHAGLIEQFARAGKAIFCEKPIDLDVDRARACLKTVTDTGTKLMVGFNRRFDTHFAAVRAAIDEGRIGTVEMVSITSRDPGPPPADYIAKSGGIFADMTIHDFDMARFLLGEEIATVYASASVLVDAGIAALGDFDSASIVLTTASGRQCLISNSRRAAYGYDQRIEVHGSKGTISAENQRPVSIELANAQGFLRPPLHDFFMTRYTQSYASEIAAFIDAVAGGTAPRPGGRDGLIALILARAALQSAIEERVVRISELPE